MPNGGNVKEGGLLWYMASEVPGQRGGGEAWWWGLLCLWWQENDGGDWFTLWQRSETERRNWNRKWIQPPRATPDALPLPARPLILKVSTAFSGSSAS